jgi:hypothetical protein
MRVSVDPDDQESRDQAAAMREVVAIWRQKVVGSAITA